MQRFIEKHRDKIIGVLSGFDRLIFRGTLRSIAYPDGMKAFLDSRHVLLKEFGAFAERTTEAVKAACEAFARDRDRPVRYLESTRLEKVGPIARRIAETEGITKGFVCLLKCLEPCRTFDIFRNREAKKIELRIRTRKCLHYYFYGFHPWLGFMGVRLQTWLPLSIQVWINGREWLSRMLDRARIRYQRQGNCFPWIADFPRAQKIMDRQLTTPWAPLLDEIAQLVNPLYPKLFEGLSYYWTVHQDEWATDIVFRDIHSLAAIYPALVHHGITRLRCEDVMRFLGQRVDARFAGQIVSDFKNRPEGVRLKHRVDANSQKLYDKEGCVLRGEHTMNNPKPFKVYRRKDGDAHGPLAWRPLRKSIADLHRRAEIGQAANERYFDAFADADTSTPIADLIATLCPAITVDAHRYRALRPWDPDDMALVNAAADGAHTIQGLRNRDIRHQLYGPDPADPKEVRRRSARVSRRLRFLRAHGLIAKVPTTHRYHVTNKGRLVFSTLLAASKVTLAQATLAA